MRRVDELAKSGNSAGVFMCFGRDVFFLFLVVEAASLRWRTWPSSLAEEVASPIASSISSGASQKVPVTIPLGCLARSKSTRQEVVRPGSLTGSSRMFAYSALTSPPTASRCSAA
jgi:hypothetical protein